MLTETPVDFGEYTPDLPPLKNPNATVISGAFPRTDRSYGPIATPAVYSGALSARCQGAFAARSKAGSVSVFAGDATKLYRLDTDATLDDVSKVGGYTISSDEHWCFAQFKERALACNISDAIQTWTLDSSSVFADLSGSAPKARYMAAVSPGFLLTGNVADGSDSYPNRVWWPAINDVTSWPTPGSSSAAAAQSGYNDLAYGGWIRGITGPVGGANGSVFCDYAIHRVEYVGTPDVFAFREVVRGRGLPAPQSLVTVTLPNGTVVAAFLADDGFYIFDGGGLTPIGNQRVDKTFYTDVDQTYLYRVYGVVDPLNKLVWWYYPNSSASAGNPNRALIWNYVTNRWAYVEDSSIACEMPVTLFTTGYTLDGLDTLGMALEDFTISFDSRVWLGGKFLFGMFNADHELAFLTGAAMAATLETGEFDGGGGRRLYCGGIRPLCDGGTLTTQVGYRNTPQESLTYTTATSVEASGACPQHVDARYMRARMSIAAGGTWTHAMGVGALVRPSGGR